MYSDKSRIVRPILVMSRHHSQKRLDRLSTNTQCYLLHDCGLPGCGGTFLTLHPIVELSCLSWMMQLDPLEEKTRSR